MHWLERLECEKGDAKLLEGLNLVLVSEYEPEVASQVHDFRRIVEQQLLVPVGVARVLDQDGHQLVVLVGVRVLVERPTAFCNSQGKEVPAKQEGRPC